MGRCLFAAGEYCCCCSSSCGSSPLRSRPSSRRYGAAAPPSKFPTWFLRSSGWSGSCFVGVLAWPRRGLAMEENQVDGVTKRELKKKKKKGNAGAQHQNSEYTRVQRQQTQAVEPDTPSQPRSNPIVGC